MKLELNKDLPYHFGQGDIAVIPQGAKIFVPVGSDKFRIWAWDGMRQEERDWHRDVGFFAKPDEVRTIWTALESVKLAAELGRKAYGRGIESAPARDAELAPLIKQWGGSSLSRQRPSHTVTLLRVMKAWSKAWHAANLAAPVPELTQALS